MDAGAEDAGGSAGCPNTKLAAVVAALLPTTGVGVVPAGAAVLMTGVTPTEPLSVTAGAHSVKMEPGFSDVGTWSAAGGDWETEVSVAGAEVDTETAEDESEGASVVDGAVAGGGGVASAATEMGGVGSRLGTVVSKGTAGAAASTAGSGATD